MLGHALLDTLPTLPATGPVAAILRHAERFPIEDQARPELAELKPSGIQAAEEFGAALRGFATVRLFHSPVKRCQQTADAIARGARTRGLAATVIGPREALGVEYIANTVEAGRLALAHGEHFIRLWFQGQVDRSVVWPPDVVGARHRDFIVRTLGEPDGLGRRLDLHVSHDWNILALREWLLGVRHEEAGWVDYLEGVAFYPAAAGVQAVHPRVRPGARA